MTPRKNVSMTPWEARAFLAEPRTAVLTTLDGDGWPHAVGMWFVLRSDHIAMWAYTKSQKIVNLRRDRRAALLVESGDVYDELKGVAVRAEARLIEDLDEVRGIGVGLYNRYTEPRTGVPVEDGPIVEIERQTPKRTGIALDLDRITSWDFTKL